MDSDHIWNILHGGFIQFLLGMSIEFPRSVDIMLNCSAESIFLLSDNRHTLDTNCGVRLLFSKELITQGTVPLLRGISNKGRCKQMKQKVTV